MLNPFFHNHEEIVKDNFECFFKITKEEVDAVVNLRLLQKKLRKKFGDIQYSDEFFDGACSAICHRENAMEYIKQQLKNQSNNKRNDELAVHQ